MLVQNFSARSRKHNLTASLMCSYLWWHHEHRWTLSCMYVCMVITYSGVWINRVRLPILLVVSWTGKLIFPCPRACLRIWSRETGSAVPSRVSLLISILRLDLVLTYGIPPEFRGGVHLWNRHTPSGQSWVYRVTQLRTDGVHCRESASTGPVNLKVVPNECCLGRSPWTKYIRLSFPHPLLVWSGHVESTGVFHDPYRIINTDSGCGKERRTLIGPSLVARVV